MPFLQLKSHVPARIWPDVRNVGRISLQSKRGVDPKCRCSSTISGRIQATEVSYGSDAKADEKEGKRDTDGRPVLTDKDEKKRQEEEAKEKPLDPK
jgi:hypothetical protein